MIRIQIEAREQPDAYRQARAIETLVRHPFVRGQFENDGIRMVGEPVVFMPQENRG